MTENPASATLLVVTASVTAFTALLPEFSEVRKATGQADLVNDVRMGEVAAFGMVTAIGLTATSLTKSPMPAMVGIISAVALVVMYESVLSATPKEKTNGTVTRIK